MKNGGFGVFLLAKKELLNKNFKKNQQTLDRPTK